jgi:hypothetical protein
MRLNSLSAEMLLARFFDASLLGAYCERRLGKSAKGSASTLAARIVAAWEKPPQKNAQSAKRRKTESDQEEWRRTLFAWHGVLHTDEPGASLTWKGAWVPLESSQSMCEPSHFATSENKFDLTSTLAARHECSHDLDSAKTWQAGPSGEWHGWYLLDQDDGAGPKRYEDTEHKFGLYTIPVEVGSAEHEAERVSVCVATGNTEFGRFVSLGRAVGTGERAVLTLCRRYVADDDARAKLRTVAAVVEFLTPSTLREASAHPWTLL